MTKKHSNFTRLTGRHHSFWNLIDITVVADTKITITESSTSEATFIEIKFANVSIGYTASRIEMMPTFLYQNR